MNEHGNGSRVVASMRRLIARESTWFVIHLVIVVVATTICVGRYCNNFLIFRAAFDHLVAGRDLYVAYPGEHGDLFKYSPTFALLFAPFSKLPFAVSLFAWNLLNVMSIYGALRLALPAGQRLEALQITGIGLVTTVDGTQSNGLVAALIVLAFASLERNRLKAAAGAISLGVLIKLFPIAAAGFALPRRDRWRFVGWGLIVGLSMVGLPLIATDTSTLAAQYRSWYTLGAVDALDRGASVMRLFHIVASYDGPNWPIQLIGGALLMLPILLRPSRWADADFRRSFLASLLVFSVIFNHKAEQPTFVIAVVGIAIWYAGAPRSPVRSILTGSTIVATVPILITVVAPGVIASSLDAALLVVTGCCTVVWLTMQGELLDLFPEPDAEPQSKLAAVSDEPAL